MTLIEKVLHLAPVIPVVVIEDASHAVPMARALVAGGLPVIEVTLRSDAALAAVRAIADEVPDAIVGTGTVRRPADLDASAKAGARFAVSPGSTPDLLAAARGHDVAWLPASASASEAMTLAEAGFTFQKFFPAQAAGGTALLRSLHGPLPEIRFCATGGISLANAAEYLATPNVACVGGSWITPAGLMRAGDWAAIEQLAREAAALRAG
ncbi:bifunctional 4-hydroxy-2-oxoglutarate aldolase/2-dehydro-3-deoxy-phosphogluconate aldolase [Marilutibacter alkalisoli]|uniref:2-dehydro-3-deoxy-phosphogluconate aldolase n=1 Tax=Marilutibacter alkalisoli TaxID=2591633 RepID=A0A514BVN4_9GAMM|nr:bifunctional 4-hydroxy-2-oxoglutarate aldolase/2-dehydro-3-deoxy-phosphogluconate aldolase [Lysobacter alkalisoli]QDH71458.1 bifunctional 4-hydroxy-2-oxoglutarate aldolase/2-dehydro-3-deoxy-phosphogluconate aldolase [Lysobacter alkalisoli]